MSSSTVSLSTELQSLIDREMARGDYADLNDLLRQALNYWASHRETIAALNEAIDQSEAGLGRPWEEVDREFRLRHGLPPRK
jgi:Arc/MetJ-type ribon-helix-helix transcriptional regulator